jgi:hypothetical protein
MTSMARLWLYRAIFVITAAPAYGGCNYPVPAKAAELLQNQIAWEVMWLGRGYLTEPVLRFKVVIRPDRVFFYLTSKEHLFDYFPGETGNQVSSRSCRNTKWLKCIEDALQWSGSTSVGAAVLGLPQRPRESIAADAVCEFEMPKRDVKPWCPSPDGDLKRRVVALVKDEIRQEASAWGTVKRAICNNFNLLDPMLWAIVEFADNNQKLLLTVEFNATTMYCNAARFEVLSNGHRALADKIRQDGLELPVGGMAHE